MKEASMDFLLKARGHYKKIMLEVDVFLQSIHYLNSQKPENSAKPKFIIIMADDIGTTLATLKQLKLDSNTLVIFCSDNGYASKMKTDTLLRGAKASVWEGGLRISAIIKWPGHIKPNTLSEETILSMDIFPTLLDLADIPNPSNLDGVSIAQHLKSQQPLPDRSLFWQHREGYAVRKENWKLVVLDTNTNPEL
jgi:arylsulfatase A-like enzyme